MKWGVLGIIAVACCAALTVSCKKPVPGSEEVAPLPPPEPGPEYSNPDHQRAYEEAWRRVFQLYEAPVPGENIWVRRMDGTPVGGELKSFDDHTLVLRDGTMEFTVAREDLKPASRAEIYADDFARREALDEVETTLTKRLSRPPLPMIGSLRYTLSDAIVPRTGPASRYARVDIPEFNRGALLEVLAQKELWIQVKPRAGGAAFWIPQLSTRPAPNAPEEDYTALINRFLQLGILVSYDAEQSEATVTRAVWSGTHPGERDGISRALAVHSARARNTTVEWIDIKDAETGRRLGRYSQAQGYRNQ
ncbi:MAG TPA: hypothetical protein PKE12_12490 [Kiritimatiellia bacterium]|nr:hypothetical protein [Kiritimatiellia bacterium]